MVIESFVVMILVNFGVFCYCVVNFDVIIVDISFSGQCGSGVLVVQDGIVQVLWLIYLGECFYFIYRDEEYYFGFVIFILLFVFKQIQDGIVFKLCMLLVEFCVVQMFQVCLMGVFEEWIEKVFVVNIVYYQFFMVIKCICECVEEKEVLVLFEGDIILILNGSMIIRIFDFDVMYVNEFLDVVIVCECQELKLKLFIVVVDDVEMYWVIFFCGVIIYRLYYVVR